jgi:hypothetical protein
MITLVLHSPEIPPCFNTELPGALNVQSLPVELHRVATNDGGRRGMEKLAEAGVNS